MSKSRDHFHYFYDLDDITEEAVRYSAMFITQAFKCDLLIRRSDAGYHLVCPNPMTREEVVKLQRFTPSDENDNWVHLDDILFREPLHGTGNTLRLSPKGPVSHSPQNLATLWVGERPVCTSYINLFTLSPPRSRTMCRCGPTFCYYTTKLRKSEPSKPACFGDFLPTKECAGCVFGEECHESRRAEA